jgi:hypothetical protein
MNSVQTLKVDNWRKMFAEYTPSFGFHMLLGVATLPQSLYMVGHTEAVHSLFLDVFHDFDGIASYIAEWGTSVAWVDEVGKAGVLMLTEGFVIQAKAMWAVCCPTDTPVYVRCSQCSIERHMI